MDVVDCITAYTSMFRTIFEKKGLPVSLWSGRVKGRFDSLILEESIRKIVRERGFSETELLDDANENSCRV